MSNRKYNFIYKTTNLVNNKFYIGQHSTDKLEDGYIGSGLLLKRAIEKYGKENFKRDILEHCDSSDSMNDREKYWIESYNGVELEECYNISEGGNGGFVANSQVTKDKISNTLKEYFSDETVRKLHSERQKEVMNRPEVKQKLKEARETLKQDDSYDNMIEKIRNSMIDYCRTEDGIALSVKRAKLSWENNRDLLTEKMIGNDYCAKNYLAMDESGKVFEITNFTKFCKDNNINRSRCNYHIGEINSDFSDLKYNQGYKIKRLFERKQTKKQYRYKLTFKDNTVEIVDDIKSYCKLHGYNVCAVYTKSDTGIPYRGILIEKLSD